LEKENNSKASLMDIAAVPISSTPFQFIKRIAHQVVQGTVATHKLARIGITAR
jgi:hypothetical protein